MSEAQLGTHRGAGQQHGLGHVQRAGPGATRRLLQNPWENGENPRFPWGKKTVFERWASDHFQ